MQEHRNPPDRGADQTTELGCGGELRTEESATTRMTGRREEGRERRGMDIKKMNRENGINIQKRKLDGR